MTAPESKTDDAPLNWWAVIALYAGVGLGLVGLLYWGDYRNATWLVLIAAGGGCTAYGRILTARGHSRRAQWWEGGAAAFYAVFFVWAGTVLLRSL